ncbi:cysteine proteinase [Hesseltinella vesiculosa]|uniref:Ubiquitin carboxyl-terminal hydrolase n=1 Tax=Hesseltinella vesiculosa TaxID=101127 RepID=A0A1X2GW71_9FUNG|nr:cysteine proteinase [Hesseltinella vesiculosa]
MTSTLEFIQMFLVDFSFWIQVFLLTLGLGLIMVPLIFAPPPSLVGISKAFSNRIGLTMLYKHCWHLLHLWMLRACEDLGLFTLFDTVAYWTESFDPQDDIDSPAQPSNPMIHLSLAPSQPDPLDICVHSLNTDYLVSGLVNTGNSCYLNSVLQALSSLPFLHVYLEQLNQQHHPLPMSRALLRTLRLLSRPLEEHQRLSAASSNYAFRPTEMTQALSKHPRVISREQQDAQELFQVLTDTMDQERSSLSVKRRQPSGLKELVSLFAKPSSNVENPFHGLFASRLSCTTCGYVEAIRHFSFNNIQLTLPQTPSATLDECLEEWTGLEYLEDVGCRKCSLHQTLAHVQTQVDNLKLLAKKEGKDKKDRLTNMVQLESQRRELETRLVAGADLTNDDLKKMIPNISIQTARGVSSKQAMFAKLPKILCFHVARSTLSPSGLVYKNKCQLTFPDLLDMQPFCTNGTMDTDATKPMSSVDPTSSCRYRLMSVIVHYGSHNYGHFITYKRQVNASLCLCSSCSSCSSHTSCEDWHGSKDVWYRISDENVDHCSLDEVLAANPYMLLYERINPDIVPPSLSFSAISSLAVRLEQKHLTPSPPNFDPALPSPALPLGMPNGSGRGEEIVGMTNKPTPLSRSIEPYRQ